MCCIGGFRCEGLEEREEEGADKGREDKEEMFLSMALCSGLCSGLTRASMMTVVRMHCSICKTHLSQSP